VFRNLVFMYGERHVHVHIGYGRENDTQPRGRDTATMPWSPPDEPARYLNDIAEMFQQQAARTATAIRGLLLAHLVCLLRSVEAPPPTGAKESDKILQCRHLISQRLADPQLSVKTLAAWLACSADYLSHCYHRETGMHLSRFITMRRMEQAQTLLRNAAMNIAEVALSCGYRDAGHFTRVFRQFTGEPPRAWRRGVNP
jgi:AraC-like DNA-binding protein